MDDRDPGLDLVHLLRRVTMELDLLAATFAATHRLHPTDLRALVHLLDADRAGLTATPGWLGAQLGMNSAGVTGLVDRLEELGHIRRVRDTTDRRRIRLAVEPQAHTIGWAFFGPLITQLVSALHDFDEAELATVRRFLQTVDGAVRTTRTARPAGEAQRSSAPHVFARPGDRPTP